MKTTEWYPASLLPKRVGWYEAQYEGKGSTRMWWFDGRSWLFRKGGGKTTFGHAEFGDQWRGLTEQAE